MAASRFFRYELRTTDMSAARAFYADVFGAGFWRAELSLVPLPEQAAARGAPPHWLGYIGVRDLDATVAAALSQGAQRLGPVSPAPDGSSRVVLRDPFGAVVGLSSQASEQPRATSVVWHLLHAQQHERAFAVYAGLFGWTATDALDLGPERGRHQMFAWDESGRSIGSVASIDRLPNIHPQWLLFFPVADIEVARASVRALGGLALETVRTGRGELMAPCDDPQGAAFGLYQAAG